MGEKQNILGGIMRPESRALGQALLNHHRQKISQYPPQPGRRLNVDRYVIPYGDLCSIANVRHITRIVGEFLAELAEWCADNGWPPINSLAVNGGTRVPGEGYDGAGGGLCNTALWPSEVEQCITFNRYPTQMP
jgi:hypothetical protein